MKQTNNKVSISNEIMTFNNIMNHYNAINITSDGNILTYISSKGLFTNSITTNDHIKYQLINDGETLPHYVVVDINMQSSNTSIIPEEKYDSNTNQYYPVTEINITLKAFDEVLTNKITHYLFVPNNVKEITIKNNDTNNNYILTINIPYQSLTADIADDLVNYQIVRYCSDQVISNYPLLSDIINLTYFSNSYFIIDSNYVSNNIEDCVNYVPNEEYELLKLISIAINKYYDNMQKLVYIKKLFISEETIKEGKEIEGLRYYDGKLMNINNDIVETISNKDLNKVTFDYQFIYYIDNNNIDRVNLSNSNKETVISDNEIISLSLFKGKLYYVVNDANMILKDSNREIFTFPTNTTIYDMIYYKQYLVIATISQYNKYSYDEDYNRITTPTNTITIFYSFDANYYQREDFIDLPTNISSMFLTSTNDKLYLTLTTTDTGDDNIKTYQFNTFTQKEFLMRI